MRVIRQAGRNLATGYLNLLVNGAVMLALTPFFVRALGDSLFGYWSILNSVVGYLSTLDLGLGTAVTKYTSETVAREDQAGRSRILSQVFHLYLGIAALVLLLGAGLALFLPSFFDLPGGLFPSAAAATFLVALNLAMALFSKFYAGVAIGHQRQDVPNLVSVASALLQGGLSYLFLRLGWGLAGLALAVALAGAAGLALRAAYCERKLGPLGISRSLLPGAPWKQLLGFSGGVFFMALGGQVVFNTDNLIIGKALDLSLVTGYALLFQLFSMAAMLSQRVSDVLFPVMVGHHALEDRANLAFYFRESTVLALASFTAMALVLGAFGEDLLSAWVGPGKHPGLPVAVSLLLFFFFQTFLHGQALVLMASGTMRTMVRLNAIEAVLNLCLSLLLVWPLGVLGVALGSLIAHLAVNVAFLPRVAAPVLGVSAPAVWRDSLLPVILPLLPALLLALLARPLAGGRGLLPALAGGAALAAAYLALVWAALGKVKREWYRRKLGHLLGAAA